GNQSGGLVFPETLAQSYSLALPGARTMPCGRTALGWTLSGMLNVQSGSPGGAVSSACALTSCAVRSGASAHTRAAMRADVLEWRIWRITTGLLCICIPGEDFVSERSDGYQQPQDLPQGEAMVRRRKSAGPCRATLSFYPVSFARD